MSERTVSFALPGGFDSMRVASNPNREGRSAFGQAAFRQSGAVLLEVVLALALFVAAAAILTSGMSSSLDSVERLRGETHAADLAVSVMSELQLGIKGVSLAGPQPFEVPLEDWSWEVLASPIQSGLDETNDFKKVEVVIRRTDPSLVYRLTQVLALDLSETNAVELLPPSEAN